MEKGIIQYDSFFTYRRKAFSKIHRLNAMTVDGQSVNAAALESEGCEVK